jgi:hypothetical protein
MLTAFVHVTSTYTTVKSWGKGLNRGTRSAWYCSDRSPASGQPGQAGTFRYEQRAGNTVATPIQSRGSDADAGGQWSHTYTTRTYMLRGVTAAVELVYSREIDVHGRQMNEGPTQDQHRDHACIVSNLFRWYLSMYLTCCCRLVVYAGVTTLIRANGQPGNRAWKIPSFCLSLLKATGRGGREEKLMIFLCALTVL